MLAGLKTLDTIRWIQSWDQNNSFIGL